MNMFKLIGKNLVKILQIVDPAPVAAAAFDVTAPFCDPSLIFFGVDIVRPQLGHIEGNDVETSQLERNVPFITLGQLLFKIRKNENKFLTRTLFIEVFDGLQNSSGNVGIIAAFNS